MTTTYLLHDLTLDEGCRLRAYRDTRGVWSVGCGHNIQADPQLMPSLTHLISPGITQAQSDALLAADVAHVKAELDLHIPWWRQIDDVRQDIIVGLGFNLGVDGLMKFHHTLGDVQVQDWHKAAVDLMASEPWVSQVGRRASRYAKQLLTGVREYPA